MRNPEQTIFKLMGRPRLPGSSANRTPAQPKRNRQGIPNHSVLWRRNSTP
jgi:hypothetical protein